VAGFLIVNPRSGDDEPTADELRRAAEDRGVRVHVLEPDDDVVEAASEADADALGIAGGDGSLAAAAGVAMRRDLPFVCIPFGTRNHFARDLGLDRNDPIGALAAFDEGSERRIDVARVNDRLFLNNLSLGVYAGLVHRRERHRRRGEARARVRALWRIAGERHRLRARVDGETVRARILLVANNAYEIERFTIGGRPTLDEGRLHLYAADGWLPHRWQEREATSFRIELGSHRVKAAADGEPIVLEPPLEFEVLPRALRVLVPPQPDDSRV
jgi:diacylglycerol kinase family enzyme